MPVLSGREAADCAILVVAVWCRCESEGVLLQGCPGWRRCIPTRAMGPSAQLWTTAPSATAVSCTPGCRKAAFFDVLRSMVDLEEQLRLAGKDMEAEVVSQAEAAWLGGRYEEWEEGRFQELDHTQLGSGEGQAPSPLGV